jgi:hypothetical protein
MALMSLPTGANWLAREMMAWRNTFQQLLPATIITELAVGTRWYIHALSAISAK